MRDGVDIVSDTEVADYIQIANQNEFTSSVSDIYKSGKAYNVKFTVGLLNESEQEMKSHVM